MSVAHLRKADQEHEEAMERLRFAVSFATAGLNASMLVNGGALVGLFTLIAPQRDLAERLWSSGLAFSAALLLTLLAWFCGFMSQDQFYRACRYSAWNIEDTAAGRGSTRDVVAATKVGMRWMLGGVVLIVGSFAAFVAGALLTLSSLA